MNTDNYDRESGHITFHPPTSNAPEDRFELSSDVTSKVVKPNKLDSEESLKIHSRLMGHYMRELHRQSDNRREMATDEDFYDNEQWTAEDRQILLLRGQQPTVYNVIATTINWMLGTERRGRTDYRILPRRKAGGTDAERKTEILKYLSDVNSSEFEVSRAFKDMVVAGIGWIECGVQSDDDGEPIYDRYESWRNMLWDSLSTDMDFDNGRYMFRSKWVDVDYAEAMFPARKSEIARATSTSLNLMMTLDTSGDDAMDSTERDYAESSGIYGENIDYATRERVRIIEAWFRVPAEDNYIKGGQFSGELFDISSNGHMAEVEQGRAEVVRKVRNRMHVAVMTDTGLLFLARSPYRHNKYPFTPMVCYRRARNGLPYGMVRAMRDPQTDVNKRVSKALYILSTRRVIMEEGAVADEAEFREEVARPDAIIKVAAGKRLEIDSDRQLASQHIDLMSRSLMMIQQVGGVTDENMGRTTNATSGKAITARQDQGALATAPTFDNLRYSRQKHGEKMLSLSEQYITQEKEIRITDKRGNPAYIRLNDGSPENDITRNKADFIVSEDDFNATIRQAQVESLLELMQMLAGTAPQVVLMTLDLLIETMDVPQREELVKRIRQMTGAEDPDADPNNPDPETMQRKQAQAEQAAFQKRAAMAELADKEASAAEKAARAEKIAVEAQKVTTEVGKLLADMRGASLDQKLRALEVAAQLVPNRSLASIADQLMTESEREVAEVQAALTPAPPEPAPQDPQAQAPQPDPQQMQAQQPMEDLNG